MKDNSIISIQDMGAAGLTSSSVEMASKGNLGIEIDLNKIPCREDKMTPYEMMLSESQERMLLILNSGKENNAKKIFDKWGLDFSVIGKTTNTKNLLLNFNGEKVANIPLSSLSKDAPIYDRKWIKTSNSKKVNFPKKIENFNLYESLKKILMSPNNSEKSWVWEQYDQTVMGDSIQKPGGNSGIIRIHGKNKGVALTVDSSAHYCLANPTIGGKQVVCESWRNLIAVGSEPIAITNCLNFGNPEKEKIMGQFVETIDGISQACEYLDFPVVSGNVSFYNETKNKSIPPTPTIGGVGLIKNLSKIMTNSFKETENHILVIGKTLGHLYQSEFFREVVNFNEGPPPEINLFNEKNNGLAVLNLISKELVKSVHDVSSGGIIVALSEMCIPNNIGAIVNVSKNNLKLHKYLFGEDQSRYIIEVQDKNIKRVNKILKDGNIYFEEIGKTQKTYMEIKNEFKSSVNDIAKLHKYWFKSYFKESA